ncbi:hypothetical protein ACFPRL_13765 [Pseudoclavibacter helvolus]
MGRACRGGFHPRLDPRGSHPLRGGTGSPASLPVAVVLGPPARGGPRTPHRASAYFPSARIPARTPH